jgi:hypothetical protein
MRKMPKVNLREFSNLEGAIVGQLFGKTATVSIQRYSQSTGAPSLTKVTLAE